MRKIGRSGWNVWRAFVGVAYLIAAAFNLFFTLPTGDLSWLADNAWSTALTHFVSQVVEPNHGLFLMLVVLFEVAVGVLILRRGRLVDLGVVSSVLWVVLLIPFLQPSPMAATNVVLALIQGALLLRRYDSSIWELVRERLTGQS